MKVDGGMIGSDLQQVAARVKTLEEAGYDGAVTAEVNSDPFFRNHNDSCWNL